MENELEVLHETIRGKLASDPSIVVTVSLSRDEWQRILEALEIAGGM